MAAAECINCILAAVIRNGFCRETQFLEQYRDHRVAVVAGAASRCVLDGVALCSVCLEVINRSQAALCIGQYNELGGTHADERGDVVEGVVNVLEARGEREQRAVCNDHGITVISCLKSRVHCDRAGAAGLVLYNDRNAQVLVTVGSDLTCDGVGAAAEAPRHNDRNRLAREITCAAVTACAAAAV